MNKLIQAKLIKSDWRRPICGKRQVSSRDVSPTITFTLRTLRRNEMKRRGRKDTISLNPGPCPGPSSEYRRDLYRALTDIALLRPINKRSENKCGPRDQCGDYSPALHVYLSTIVPTTNTCPVNNARPSRI